MDLTFTFFRGSVIVSSPVGEEAQEVVHADIPSMARELGKHLRYLVVPTNVPKPKGTKGFSFHWSNAQRAWDVIPANDPTWRTDGAEFLVYFTKSALSPLKKPWSLKEMEYVAMSLPEHPGFAQSFEASRVASVARVAAKYLGRSL
jgi:hypothetical protein